MLASIKKMFPELSQNSNSTIKGSSIKIESLGKTSKLMKSDLTIRLENSEEKKELDRLTKLVLEESRLKGSILSHDHELIILKNKALAAFRKIRSDFREEIQISTKANKPENNQGESCLPAFPQQKPGNAKSIRGRGMGIPKNPLSKNDTN